jgi:hypothetical protein
MQRRIGIVRALLLQVIAVALAVLAAAA